MQRGPDRADRTTVELPPAEHARRCTRLDMQYLCALIQEIERMPEVRDRIAYYPNDSLYAIGGKYRYVEYRYVKSQRRHTVSSLEIDEALETLLRTAARVPRSTSWCGRWPSGR